MILCIGNMVADCRTIRLINRAFEWISLPVSYAAKAVVLIILMAAAFFASMLLLSGI